MSQKEQEILESMAKALPEMPDIKKGEFLGYAKAMVDLKKQMEQQSGQAEMTGVPEEKGA